RQAAAFLGDAALALAASLPLGAADTLQRLDQVGRALLTDLRDDRIRLRELMALQTQQANDLREAAQHNQSGTTRLGAAAQALAEATPRMDAALRTIEQSQTDLIAIQTSLRDTARNLETTVTTVLTQQENNVRAAVGPLAAAAQAAMQASTQLNESVAMIL